MFYLYSLNFMFLLAMFIAGVSEAWTLILKRDTADTFMKWVLALWIVLSMFLATNAFRNAIDARVTHSSTSIECEYGPKEITCLRD